MGGSMLGSSRRVRRMNDMPPSTTSSRLTTIAKTGRRIDRSDSFIGSALAARAGAGGMAGGGRGPAFGRGRRGGIDHLHPRAQLAGALDHDAVAGGQALGALGQPP